MEIETTNMQNQIFSKLIEEWKKEEQKPFTGWDFSYLEGRMIEEKPPWSYEDRVKELMKGTESLLDLGTGGGEKLLQFRDIFPPKTFATEGYRPNYLLAKERLKPFGVTIVFSNDSLEQILPFDDETFDLVIDRHTSFNISEVDRVLKKGGTFLTQQVDGKSLEDLMATFDCAPNWSFFNLDFVLQKVQETDLTVLQAQESKCLVQFKDVGTVVYFLKAIPWFVDNFSVERYLPNLLKLQEEYQTKGILTFHSKYLMMEAKKGV